MNDNPGDQTLQWSGSEQLDPMPSIQDMDFSNFLDIGDLDLTGFSPLGHDQHIDGTNSAPLMRDAQPLQSDPMMHDFGADQFELPMAMDQEEALHSGSISAQHDNLDFAHNANSHSWSQNQQQQSQNQNRSHSMQGQVYHPPQQVPPTPNSYELHGNPGRYFQHQMDNQTRNYLEQRYQLQKDDAMAFTPLVSPAVTPQDSHFQTLPEYTIPGAYFSPLTSPALQAQNASQQQQQQQQVYGYHANPSTAGSSVATSPIDLNMDVDMTGSNAVLSEGPRRTKRKTQAPRSAGPSARMRQSPIVKAQQKRRSTHMSSVIPSKDVQNILREAQLTNSPQTAAASMRNSHVMDSSGTDSISPEPLSESVMGPPPRPVSAIHSPAIQAQTQSAPVSATVDGMVAAPATPASLMSLQRTRQLNLSRKDQGISHSLQPPPQISDDLAMFDDFALPPAANTNAQRPDLGRIITSTPPVSADATPRLAARKTSKAGACNTPLSALAPLSASSSPAISAIASPSTVTTPSSLVGRKPDNKNARASKKRGSVGGPGSALISPAIRPKISPSIKPLLPDGANLNESQQALLLASKSNYTHILEGTLLPGVTYPESLSSGLTSKRTSHKIAEQGRRNRINDALKEMQALLPKVGSRAKSTNGTEDEASKTPAAATAAADEDDADKDGSKAASAESKSANSKAATVESAIDYIKALQVERLQTAEMMKAKDAEMALLRQQLLDAGLQSNGSAASASSVGEESAGTTTTTTVTTT